MFLKPEYAQDNKIFTQLIRNSLRGLTYNLIAKKNEYSICDGAGRYNPAISNSE